MTSYVDARQRLLDKSKSRGFWPVRPKGAGKTKGAAKGRGGGFAGNSFRGRKPLSVRIAESTCRLCKQRGHWKAECPRRSQSQVSSSSGPPKSVATANLVSVQEELSDEDADVFVVPSDTDFLTDPGYASVGQELHRVFGGKSHSLSGCKVVGSTGNHDVFMLTSHTHTHTTFV